MSQGLDNKRYYNSLSLFPLYLSLFSPLSLLQSPKPQTKNVVQIYCLFVEILGQRRTFIGTSTISYCFDTPSPTHITKGKISGLSYHTFLRSLGLVERTCTQKYMTGIMSKGTTHLKVEKKFLP